MWAMFSGRPPHTVSLEERAKSSTRTTGAWPKSGWMISKTSFISYHQVQSNETATMSLLLSATKMMQKTENQEFKSALLILHVIKKVSVCTAGQRKT